MKGFEEDQITNIRPKSNRVVENKRKIISNNNYGRCSKDKVMAANFRNENVEESISFILIWLRLSSIFCHVLLFYFKTATLGIVRTLCVYMLTAIEIDFVRFALCHKMNEE